MSRRRWVLGCLALVSPPVLTYLCLQLALAIDRLHIGPPWQIIVVYLVGPGALTCGLLGAVGAAHLIFPASRLARGAIVVAEMALSVGVVLVVDPVQGWK